MSETNSFETYDDVKLFLDSPDNNDKFLVFKIGADWCGPCQRINPHYEKIMKSDKYENTIFNHLDVDTDDSIRELMDEYDLKKIPHFIIFKNSEKKSSIQTSNANRLDEFLKENL